MEETFGSTAHGAGRKLSRRGAKKKYSSSEIKKVLKVNGINNRKLYMLLMRYYVCVW